MFLLNLWEGFLKLGNRGSLFLGDEGDEGDEGSGDEGEGEGSDDGQSDAGQDGGKNTGDDDRSTTIPRERFDQVNKHEKGIAKLVELGILTEAEGGNLELNQDVLKNVATKKPEEAGESAFDKLALSKDDVDKDSWGIADKINKRFDSANKSMSNLLALTNNRIKIIMDYPEFITKDSPLRKKAMEIAKTDKEFMGMIQGRSDFEFQLVKRASELLSGKTPTKPKKKGKFIVGKGDAGESGKPKGKLVKDLSPEELDVKEKEEFDRLFPQGKLK